MCMYVSYLKQRAETWMTGMKKDERSREFTSLPNINTWLNVQQFWNKSQLWKRKISSWWCLHINVEVRAAYSFFKKCCFFDRKFSTYYWFWITYSCKQKHMLLLRKSTLNGISNQDMFCFRVWQCCFRAYLLFMLPKSMSILF